MKTFSQLKQNVRDRLWPSGDPENLAATHDKFVLEALIEIQQLIDCQQYNNTELVPHCSTLFQSGMTVFDAPRGIIRALHVVDRVDGNGKEDISKPLHWAGRVLYRNLSFPDLEQLALGPNPTSCQSLWDRFRVNCGSLQKKFPTPTDEDYVGKDKLPLGYHYSQASTDSSYGRSMHGTWASHRGRIYTFPWIQSTETILIEWDGIKRSFSDDDVVDDDPLLEKAVVAYVEKTHSEIYDADYQRSQVLEIRWREALAQLRHACREETRVRDREESHARQQNEKYAIGSLPTDSILQSGCPAVEAPTLWPPKGATVVFPTQMGAATDVEGATLHYTANGEDPTKNSPKLSAPITVVDGMDVRVVAVDTQGCSSPVVRAGYVSDSVINSESDFYRLCSTNDRSGPWHVFEADGGEDWNWRLKLPISENTEIKHLELYQTEPDGSWTTGQVWSTKQNIRPPGYTADFAAYPLVLVDDSGQLNYSYVDSLGVFTSDIDWTMYGDTVEPDLGDQHYLLRIYTDRSDKPIDFLMDGEPCGKRCCNDRCGTQTLGDERLTIELDRKVANCGATTGVAGDCYTEAGRFGGASSSSVRLDIDGTLVLFKWVLTANNLWALEDVTGTGVDWHGGYGSSTSDTQATDGKPDGTGNAYITVGGVKRRVQMTINGPDTLCSGTTTTSSTSTTTTSSTTSSTTTASPCADPDQFTIAAEWQGDSSKFHSVAAEVRIDYYDPGTESMETTYLNDQMNGLGINIHSYCGYNWDGLEDITYEIAVHFSANWEEAGGGLECDPTSSVNFSGSGLPFGSTFTACMQVSDCYNLEECS